MTNVAFAALVLFEVAVAFFAALTLYVLWWPSIQHTVAMVPETAINCSDTGRVPHYTMEEAVRALDGACRRMLARGTGRTCPGKEHPYLQNCMTCSDKAQTSGHSGSRDVGENKERSVP